MKYVETIIAFFALTALTLFTVAAIKTLNEIDIQKEVVSPIVYNATVR